MSLLYMDSFDHYVTADLSEKWATVNTQVGSIAINPTAGRRSSGTARISPAYGGTTYLGLNTPVTTGQTVIIGMAINLDRIPIGGALQLISLLNISTIQLTMMMEPGDSRLRIRRGGAVFDPLLGTSSIGLTLGSYQYLEMKVFLSTTVGTVDVRINGASVLALTGVNTCSAGNTGLSSVVIGESGNALGSTSPYPVMDIDDFYYCDGVGAAPWNTFLGDVRVDARLPTAPGATTGFTPLAGANWQNVDDATPDDDTTYNSTLTLNAIDTFVTQDAPVVGATILGVQTNISVKKTDAGTCTIAPVIRHSGTDNVGAVVGPGITYGYATQTHQVNPGTGAAWTEAGFNAAEFGYKRLT